MLELLFYTVLFSDIILILGVIFSVGFPRYRIWPPPSKNSWQYWSLRLRSKVEKWIQLNPDTREIVEREIVKSKTRKG